VSKYKNVRTRGFASKREAARYDELKLLEKAGEICALQCQVKFPLQVEGKLICTYIADFCYRLKNEKFSNNEELVGELVVEDVKGVRTPIYRLKAKLMKAVYGIKILET
jgi:hypothetical protein